MEFVGINYLAVVAATVVSMITGAVWYGAFAKPWMKAVSLKEEDIEQKPSLYIIAAFSQLVMAWMLAGVIGHLGEFGIANGMITAFFCWLGFVITAMSVNHRFQGSGWDLTLIDGGYWLAVLLLQGAVIGWFGA